MLIDLDESLQEKWAELEPLPEFRDAMHNLARGFYEGKHLGAGNARSRQCAPASPGSFAGLEYSVQQLARVVLVVR